MYLSNLQLAFVDGFEVFNGKSFFIHLLLISYIQAVFL